MKSNYHLVNLQIQKKGEILDVFKTDFFYLGMSTQSDASFEGYIISTKASLREFFVIYMVNKSKGTDEKTYQISKYSIS